MIKNVPVQTCGASTITAVKKIHVGNITAISHQHKALRAAARHNFTLNQTMLKLYLLSHSRTLLFIPNLLPLEDVTRECAKLKPPI